jgi:ketosteroid isomerase-like protein
MGFAVAVLCALAAGSLAARTSPASGDEKMSGMSSTSMKGDAALQQKLEAIERKGWEAFKAQDFKAFSETMAPDAMSVDMNGLTSSKDMESMMKDYAVQSYTLSDFKIVKLDKDAAVLTYTTNATATYKGQPMPAGPVYCSSVYVMRGGKWMAMYHQETLSMSAMQSAAAAATENK